MPEIPIDLYSLLPALYRIRDEGAGAAGSQGAPGPLRELLELIEQQAELLRSNIEGLHDDFFIETCAPWVIPYIGELVGNNPLHDIGESISDGRVGDLARTRRADVARTIYYRQRKGTYAALEEIASDVTGWEARIVPFFERLSWTQNLDHLRVGPENAGVGTISLRRAEALDRMSGTFGDIAHSVDIRPISNASGWYAPRKVGIFLWRLQSFRMTDVPASSVGDRRYFINPVPPPVWLYNSAESSEGPSTEQNFPQSIHPRRFADDPAAWLADGSLAIRYDGHEVPATEIQGMDLSNWAAEPPKDAIGVDVVLGRLKFGANRAIPLSVRVDYCYGFPGPIGGGPYRRRPLITSQPEPTAAPTVPTLVGPGHCPTISQAIQQPVSDPVIIEITDNRIYSENLAIAGNVVIRAGDCCRPTLLGQITVKDSLTLDGLLIVGAIRIQGDPKQLTLSHCTLVPNPDPTAPSICVDSAATSLSIHIERSITGRLVLPPTVAELRIADSIIDSGAPDGTAIAGSPDGKVAAPSATLQRVTVLGASFFHQIVLANECLFMGTLRAERLQGGCIRFSYVPPDSQTPRRYRCQPDLSIEGLDAAARKIVAEQMTPMFVSDRYGEPAYAQLSVTCPPEIARGAESGGEMGAWGFLFNPLREANLRIRLEEYLPVELDADLIYVS